jgi:hypothetical protein
MFGVAIRRRAAPEGGNVAGEPDHGRVKQTIPGHRGQVACDQESGGRNDFGLFVRVVTMEIRPIVSMDGHGPKSRSLHLATDGCVPARRKRSYEA